MGQDPSDRLHSTRSYHYNQDIGAEIEEPQFYAIPPGKLKTHYEGVSTEDRPHTGQDPSDRLHSIGSYHYNQDIGPEIEEPKFYAIPPGNERDA